MEGPCPPSPAYSWDSNQLDDDALEELETELYGQLHYSHVDSFSEIPEEPKLVSKETPQVTAIRNCLITTSVGQDKGKHLRKTRELSSSTPARTEKVIVAARKSPREEVEDSRYSTIARNLKKPKLVVLETPSSSLESSDSNDSIVCLGSGTSPTKSKALVNLGFSDSDLDSISDESLIECSDMQLNLSSMTARLSKSAVVGSQQPLGEQEYSQYICRKWTKAMIDYYEQDGADIDIEEVESSFPSNARWPVVDEDLWGSSSSRSTRYFNKKRVRCNNCNQMDHLARHCPDPVRPVRCHMCGETGHKEPRCPRKLCLGCGAFNGIYSESCRSCLSFSSTTCSICNQKGHRNDLCPDFWRRYHLTLSGLTPKRPAANAVFMKPTLELFCCNCAQRGHLAVHCTSLKTSRYAAVTPVVYDYTNSFQYCERFVNGETSCKPDNYLAVESHNNRFLGEKSIKYSFNATDKTTEHRIKELACLLEANVPDVDVHWRKQKKKNRVFVEFKGRGNVKEARDLFKKHLHRSGSVKHNVTAEFSKAAFVIDYMNKDGVKTQKVLKMKLDSKIKSEVRHALSLVQKWFGLCVQASFQNNMCKITFENAKHSQDAFRRLESLLKDINKKHA